MRQKLKAPFPWFGGKSRVAHLVWPRFGNVPNYVEPFAGSLAIMLLRPHEPKIETVNDLDCYIANFWRAVKHDPEAVAAAADWPVNEADLHARHQWLHKQEEFRERMHTEKDFYDAELAGIWVWGISAWIGDNWCRTSPQRALPHISIGPKGIHRLSRKRPNITGWAPKGVHAAKLSRQKPDISGDSGAAGRGVHAKYARPLYDYFNRLASRLRQVRVCCGEWYRILGPSPTVKIGITAVFLDPPYGAKSRDKVYNCDSRDLAGAVQEWCREHGADKKLRIALCGYEGEHNILEALGWDKTAWKAQGGYGARNPKNKNADRERIWFSPHCQAGQRELFEKAAIIGVN